MGRSRPVALAQGVLALPISFEPTILTLHAAKATAAVVASPVDCAAIASYSGRSGATTIRVVNTLGTRMTGTLTIASDTADVTPPQTAIALAPGASRDIVAHFTARPGTGPKRALHVTLAGVDSLPSIARDIALQQALAVPRVAGADAPWGDQPTVALSGPRNAVSLFAATYEDALKFHGDGDLSAKAWVRGVPSGIQVRVVVTDDVQSQEFAGIEMWKGDSVQFALAGVTGRVYEWVVGLTKDGACIARLQWPGDVPANAAREQAAVTRTGTTTVYDIMLPATIPDVAMALRSGCTMSLLVNDNDGKGRKGWLEWTPGIGIKKDPNLFAPVVFMAQ